MKKLTSEQHEKLLAILQKRFETNMDRHANVDWTKVQSKLESNPEKLWSLNEMDRTGGEPDVVILDNTSTDFVFCDCSEESPKGRRSLCYDDEARESRKEHKPAGSALGMADEMGVELLTEEQYRQLQSHGTFDIKTSSWIETPAEIRKLGGALFCDCRYNNVFTYHNGAESYYASRGFRGLLKI